ncbi:sodium solute symporter [Aureococcus anophagefferens]|nr:sodium solute symporter [Aureococcus anophagefferens]
MSNRRQSVASQLQSERDCRRWAGWMNGRLEGAIAAAELAAIGAEEFAARLRSGAPRGLRGRRHREPSRIEAVDNLNCVFGALARLGVNHGHRPLDVADAKTELVLGLVWSIVAPRPDLAERSSGASFGGAYAEAAAATAAASAAAVGGARQPAGAATAGDVWDGLRRDAALVKPVAAAAANASRRAVAADEAADRGRRRAPPAARGHRGGLGAAAGAPRGARGERQRRAPRRGGPRRGRGGRSAALRGVASGAARASARDRDAAVAAAAARASSTRPSTARRRATPPCATLWPARRRGGVEGRRGARGTAVDAAIAEERRGGGGARRGDGLRAHGAHGGPRGAPGARGRPRAEKRGDRGGGARLGAKHGEALRLMQSQAEEAIAKSRDDALAEAAEAPPPQSPGLPDEHASSAALAKLAEASEGTVAYSAAAFAALKTTMEYLKGHAVSLHRRESSKLLKALDRADDGVARAKLFKHAHLKVKEVVVRVTRSNQRSGRHWEPFHGARPSDRPAAASSR